MKAILIQTLLFVVVLVLSLSIPAISKERGLTAPIDRKAEKHTEIVCKRKVLSSRSVNYKTCIKQQTKELKPLMQLWNKYASNHGYIGGWCGTEEARQALGIRLFPLYPRPLKIYKGEATSWGEVRKIDGWVIHTLYDAWSNPIPELPLFAVKESTIEVKNGHKADNGFGAGVYCVGYIGTKINNDWFGFPIDVFYFDAIYP